MFWYRPLFAIAIAVCLVTQVTATTAVTFTFQPLPSRHRWQQRVSVRMKDNVTYEQSQQIIFDERNDKLKRQTRDMVLLPSDSTETVRARLTYVHASTKNAEKWHSRATPQAVAGKTYRVARRQGALHITCPNGDAPPETEREIVQADMRAFGKPNPLAKFLNGRTVKIGDRLELPPHIAADLLSDSAVWKHADLVTLQLRSVRKVFGQECGQFAMNIGSRADGDAQSPVHAQGEIAVAIGTCRTLRTLMDATFSITEERGPEGFTFRVKHRGTAHIEIESRDGPVASARHLLTKFRHLLP